MAPAATHETPVSLVFFSPTLRRSSAVLLNTRCHSVAWSEGLVPGFCLLQARYRRLNDLQIGDERDKEIARFLERYDDD